ncbi:hypothetical protein BOTNAR_0317g00150 [Botryotinia narcissicola]|uniref:Uncharacterized protein n=1 Tax=Botryotinia narcissicola TaxID=278944 RepID=A0A4Z1I1T0_9HELO|nr:hypothetical protein BOTNAR_0317g00150 [Botryotinia narcissicola]
MSSTLLTTYSCGHEERSATRIGEEQQPGVMGIIRRMSSKSPSGAVIADSALLCTTCREKPHPEPLRSHPVIIIRPQEPRQLDRDDVNPYANEFPDLQRYGAHDFTRKRPDDVDRNVPPTSPVILSRPISPLLTAPDNLEDKRGVLTEYRCGHHKVSSVKEKGIVLGVDKLGFLLIQSKHRCPRCFAHGIEESSSDKQSSTRGQPEETPFVPLDGSDLEIADNMDMGTLARQTRQREALATFDSPPTPLRRDSKREKAKKIDRFDPKTQRKK